ncbi:MAG: hypothetical protein ABSH08_03945 [Tepidisphaeraceae bacterium]
MKSGLIRAVSAAVLVLAVITLAGQSRGQTMNQAGSGVQAYFGSQSSLYEAADPTALPWPAPGPGPYNPAAGLPNVPPPPGVPVWPTFSGNAFQGSGWVSNFNDLLGTNSYTAATSVITDSYTPSPTLTQDASIQIPAWRLYQAPAAPGYAYEQLDLAAAYAVIGGTLGGSTPNFPLYINGSTATYAQFGVVLKYFWTPSNNSAFTASGPTVSLGTLDYSFLTGGGPFATTVTSTGNLFPTPTSQGILEISGEMWLAGDPVDITVSTVPEPASFGLLTVASILMLKRHRRANPAAVI